MNIYIYIYILVNVFLILDFRQYVCLSLQSLLPIGQLSRPVGRWLSHLFIDIALEVPHQKCSYIWQRADIAHAGSTSVLKTSNCQAIRASQLNNIF